MLDIEIAVVVRLDGTPSDVCAAWIGPDGTRHIVHEPLDEGCEMEEALRCVQLIREAILHDPF